MSILLYQKNRRLDECPGFTTAVQFRNIAGEALFLGLRTDSVEIYHGPEISYVFDLEGRLLRSGHGRAFLFRGFSGKGYRSILQPMSRGGGFQRSPVTDPELRAVCEEAAGLAARLEETMARNGEIEWSRHDPGQTRAMLLPILSRIRSWTWPALREDRARFEAIYQPVTILPPDHYQSLVLQATEGCSFNTCTFCNFYQNQTFRIRDDATFARHIDDVLAFHGRRMIRFERIFLGQANALAIPQNRLIPLLKTLGEKLEVAPVEMDPVRTSWLREKPPRFRGISAFLDGFTGLRKSADDYAVLRGLGLRRVFVGVETGSDRLLQWLRKPATREQMRGTIRNLREAGLRVDIIILVGAGGSRWGEEHFRETMDFIRESALAPGDRVYLSPIVVHPESEYARLSEVENILPLSAEETREQTSAFAHSIRREGLQAVPYRTADFVY